MNEEDIKGSGRTGPARRFTERVLERYRDEVLLIARYGPLDLEGERGDEVSDIEIIIVTRKDDEDLRRYVFDICSDIYFREEKWISVYCCSSVRYRGYNREGFFRDLLKRSEILWKGADFDQYPYIDE